MAKDPRFNFYPDNYLGGTLGFTLEQHGAYLQLLILQSKLLQFTQEQAINHIATFYRGNYRGATELWQFLLPKFETDGTKFWNARLRKEMEKSKIHSQKQSERVKSRYSKNNGTTAVVPDNSIGIGNGNGIEEKGVQGETNFQTKDSGPVPLSEDWFNEILDSKTLDELNMTFRDKDVSHELTLFKAKARAAPSQYQHRDKGGIMLAIHKQLRDAKPKKKNANGTNQNISTAPAKTFGALR